MKFIITFLFVLCHSINIYSAQWFNPYWKKRITLQINNPETTNITDIQVRISTYITTGLAQYWSDIKGGTGNSDLSDIRFTKSDGMTELSNYWIEDDTNTLSKDIWLKYDGELFPGTTRIFMYYGNSSAYSISKGTNVFEFFDDFNSTGTNFDIKWSTVDTKWTLDNGQAKHNGNLDGWVRYILSNKGNINGITEIKLKVLFSDGDPDCLGLVIRSTDVVTITNGISEEFGGIRFLVNPKDDEFVYKNRDLNFLYYKNYFDFNKWYKLKVYHNGTAIQCYIDYDDGQDYILELTTQTPYIEGTHIGFMGQYADSYVDYIFQRKPYEIISSVSTDPVIGPLSSPELTPIEQYYVTQSSEVKFYCSKSHHYKYLFNNISSSKPCSSDFFWDGSTKTFVMNSFSSWYLHILGEDENNEPLGYTDYGPIIYCDTSPSNFNLKSPSDNSISSSTLQIFQWYESIDICPECFSHYIFYISTDNFTTSYSSVTINTSITLNLNQNIYQWKVYAVDKTSNITQSNQIWKLIIDTTPPIINTSELIVMTTDIIMILINSTDTLSGLNSAPFLYENINISSSTGWISTTYYTFTDLTPNTSYMFRIKIRDRLNNEITIDKSTATTYANPPTNIAIPIHLSSYTICTWSKNSNPDCTEYFCAISSVTPYISFKYSGWIKQTTWSVSELIPDTTYYFYIKSRNLTGIETTYISTKTILLSNPPLFTGITNKTTDTLCINWNKNGNPDWTEYFCEISSVSISGPYTQSSGWTNLLSSTFTNLQKDTKYYYHIKSRNTEKKESITIVSSYTATYADNPKIICLTHEKNRYTVIPEVKFILSGSNHYHYVFSQLEIWTPGQNDTLWIGDENLFLIMTSTGSWWLHIRGENIINELCGYDNYGPIILTSPPATGINKIEYGSGTKTDSSGIIYGVNPDTALQLTFNINIDTNTLIQSTYLKAIKDNQSNSINIPIPGTITYDTMTYTLVFISSEPLKKGYVYELIITTSTKDFADRNLDKEIKYIFTTLYDSTLDNILTNNSKKIKLNIPKNSLNYDYFILFDSISLTDTNIVNANKKLFDDWGYSPVNETIFDYKLYNSNGKQCNPNFNIPIKMFISYLDSVSNNENYIARLNDTRVLWEKLPSSDDKQNRTISAELNHLSIYSVITKSKKSVSEIDDVYAYPVPWRPNTNKPERYGTLSDGITFTNLPSNIKIRIYNISGEFIKEINHTGTEPTEKWIPKTESGKDLPSGVYIYILDTGTNKKTGKLMIIR